MLYEVGLAHGLGKHVVALQEIREADRCSSSHGGVPADLREFGVIEYCPDGESWERETIQRIGSSIRVFKSARQHPDAEVFTGSLPASVALPLEIAQILA